MSISGCTSLHVPLNSPSHLFCLFSVPLRIPLRTSLALFPSPHLSPSPSLSSRLHLACISLSLFRSRPPRVWFLCFGLVHPACVSLSLFRPRPPRVCFSVFVSASSLTAGPGHPSAGAPPVPDDPGHRRLLLRLHAPSLDAPQLNRLRLRTLAGQRHGECRRIPAEALSSGRARDQGRTPALSCRRIPAEAPSSGWTRGGPLGGPGAGKGPGQDSRSPPQAYSSRGPEEWVDQEQARNRGRIPALPRSPIPEEVILSGNDQN